MVLCLFCNLGFLLPRDLVPFEVVPPWCKLRNLQAGLCSPKVPHLPFSLAAQIFLRILSYHGLTAGPKSFFSAPATFSFSCSYTLELVPWDINLRALGMCKGI